ncbi:MAG: histidine--tRNA ligase [Candidatus Diapherotrites archaeon]|uniref:Histidine--tRNA ligase n=1 Tax=Candidatus Iainarchaeum sp. TaxID=3101447 RepID=A0A8T3YRX4_9ARCH|nr:histidine--tRNA ligase [Candidatus Diapherotrites archaeon]
MAFQTVRGMRDFLPEQARKKQFIEDLCRRTFERYGFEPLQTPILEDFALLSAKGSGGEAIKDEIYYFKDKGERELGMRYDLTVPLARIAAGNPSLPKPFKRYCVGTVYRYDRPQAKRYREFTQADFDILGSKSVLSDFEILNVACDVMRALGLEFKVKVNNRKVLEELAKKCSVQETQVKDTFRAIDKLDKIGEKEVRRELREKGIDDTILGMIFTNSFDDVKAALGGAECVEELGSLLDMCGRNGLVEVAFDLSLARGLEYYTGMVFEVALESGPSVCGGGRYDRLAEAYGGQPTPALGGSFGIDRILDTIEKDIVMGKGTDIFIAAASPEGQSEAIKIAARLRKAGTAVETDVMGRSVKNNIDYANRSGIGFFAAIGEDEIKRGTFRVKEMSSGREMEFRLDDTAAITALLKG